VSALLNNDKTIRPAIGDAKYEPASWRLPVIAALGGLALYVWTCAPGVEWADGATFQVRIWRMDLHGRLGLALAHPLYILLARAFTLLPLGNFAHRVNLFSAMCSAVTLGLAMHLLMTLTRSRASALIGVILLAVSHTFWRHSVVAVVYALYGLCLLGELCLIERWFATRHLKWLVLAAALNGLSISNHMLASLHVPAYGLLLWWGIRNRRLAIEQLRVVSVAFVAGSSLYWGLMLQEIIGGAGIAATLHSALFGTQFQDRVLNSSIGPGQLRVTAEYFVLNFPTKLLIVAPIGWWMCWRRNDARWFAAIAGGIFLVAFVFAFRYPVADQYVFFFPCYVLWALFVAFAMPQPARRRPIRMALNFVFAVLPAVVYEVAPESWRQTGRTMPGRTDVPFRDKYKYFLRPRLNGEDSAERFARAALQIAAPDGLLIADSTLNGPLVYMREVEGVCPGVAISIQSEVVPHPPVVATTFDAVRPYADRGAAYLCSDVAAYVPDWVPAAYDLERVGPIFRLKPRTSGASHP
jgi:hypothetical protein